MERAPSFMNASSAPPPKQKKSLVSHLFFGGRFHPHPHGHGPSAPGTPSIRTPAVVTPGMGISDTAYFPASPTTPSSAMSPPTSNSAPTPAPKLSVASPSVASIGTVDIDAALHRATLPRLDNVDTDLVYGSPQPLCSPFLQKTNKTTTHSSITLAPTSPRMLRLPPLRNAPSQFQPQLKTATLA